MVPVFVKSSEPVSRLAFWALAWAVFSGPLALLLHAGGLSELECAWVFGVGAVLSLVALVRTFLGIASGGGMGLAVLGMGLSVMGPHLLADFGHLLRS